MNVQDSMDAGIVWDIADKEMKGEQKPPLQGHKTGVKQLPLQKMKQVPGSAIGDNRCPRHH